jgi:hypothetical protein
MDFENENADMEINDINQQISHQEIIRFFFKTQNQLKLLHWQTTSYSKHKAFEETYEELDELMDNFVEVFQGKYGRIFLEDSSIQLCNINDDGINDFIQDSIQFLSIQLPSIMNKDGDIDSMNIKDEMIGKFNKLRYLLTLK